MNINQILGKLDFSIPKKEHKEISNKTKYIVSLIKNEIKKPNIKAEVFVGGSFAKSTLMKGDKYDVDIFVRFDKKYEENISSILEKVIKRICSKNELVYAKIHGSRDYYRIFLGNVLFEIIPVIKIKKYNEANNITDLSYSHVKYAKKRLNNKLIREILLTKAFFNAQGIYGAEGYIRGFSGYGVECLIIHYKSFQKMAYAIIKSKDKLVLDPEKQYKNSENILLELNESKLQSPIVLIDPTFKERNVLAAVSQKTFDKAKVVFKKFLDNPNKAYFEQKEMNEKEWSKDSLSSKSLFKKIELETNRQPGDIAGSKLKKFSDFLINEIEKYFIIVKNEFVYDDEKKATIYLLTKAKDEIIKKGPPITMKKASINFKKFNKNAFVKQGSLYSKQKISFNFDQYFTSFKAKNKDKIEDMGIVGIKLIW